MSQKRFFLLMQKLEDLEQEISLVKQTTNQIADASANIEQMTSTTDARLIFAGMALLLSHPEISSENRTKYNSGWDVQVKFKE